MDFNEICCELVSMQVSCFDKSTEFFRFGFGKLVELFV